MPKVYFCKQILENGIQCNESNPDNFPSGRYTTCKNCRRIKNSGYIKTKRLQSNYSPKTSTKEIISKLEELNIKVEKLTLENNKLKNIFSKLDNNNDKS